MKKLTNYLLPIQTKDLYAKEAVSSISLAHDVADKINEIVNYLNTHEDLTNEKILEQDGKIRKGIIYMKDNLANTIHELLELMKSNGEVKEIVESSILNRTLENGNVLDYGAVGDGKYDSYEAFKKALEKCKTVYVPDGTYYISKPITLEWGKSLIGSENGSYIIVDDNSFLELKGRNTVKNLKIENTKNVSDSLVVTEASPLIKGTLSYSNIENINIGLSYIGIDVEVKGKSNIKDIYGCPLKYGIKIDNSVDVVNVDNIHFNQNYYGSVSPILKNYMFENGYAMYIGRADWGNVSNIFCLGYKGLMYLNNGSKTGGSANNFVIDNWGCDGCKSLLFIKNYGGGFKFINGNATFYNFFYDEILASGLTPSHAETYPINLSLGYSSASEEPCITFKNNRFYRCDYNLLSAQYNTEVIFEDNIISNVHMINGLESGTPPTIFLGAGTRAILSNNIFRKNKDLTATVIGVNNNGNTNNIITNNIFINYNTSINSGNDMSTNNKIIME